MKNKKVYHYTVFCLLLSAATIAYCSAMPPINDDSDQEEFHSSSEDTSSDSGGAESDADDPFPSRSSVTSHDSSLLELQKKGLTQGHDLEGILGEDHTQTTLEQAKDALERRRGVEIRIGATDAGGIRGVIPVKLWRHLQNKTGKKIHELFDWLTGSSTGAIVAIAMAARKPVSYRDKNKKKKSRYENVMSLDNLFDLYTTKGDEIFSGWSYFNPKGIRGPIYNPEGKMQILTDILGDLTMLDVFCDIAVPFFDWNEGENVWYTSVAVREGILPNIYLRDLAQASSSPLLYLPAHHFKSIDGTREFWGMDPGTYLPNTALHALDIARARDPAEGQFLVVSMGTGKYKPKCKLTQVMNTNLLTAAPLLLAMSMKGSTTSANTALECQLNRDEKQYYRFDPYLGDTNPDLDNVDPDYIERLRRMTREHIRVLDTEFRILSSKLTEGLTDKSDNLLRFELLQLAQQGYIEGVAGDAGGSDGRQGYTSEYTMKQPAPSITPNPQSGAGSVHQNSTSQTSSRAGSLNKDRQQDFVGMPTSGSQAGRTRGMTATGTHTIDPRAATTNAQATSRTPKPSPSVRRRTPQQQQTITLTPSEKGSNADDDRSLIERLVPSSTSQGGTPIENAESVASSDHKLIGRLLTGSESNQSAHFDAFGEQSTAEEPVVSHDKSATDQSVDANILTSDDRVLLERMDTNLPVTAEDLIEGAITEASILSDDDIALLENLVSNPAKKSTGTNGEGHDGYTSS